MAKKGRPTKYTDLIAKEICARLARGESLNTICQLEQMPDKSTVYDWLHEGRGDFPNKYALAREKQMEHWAEECLEIADETSNDTIIKTGKNGEEYESQNSEWINRSRLRVDTRKWLMSKLAPKKYGDKQTLEHSGPNGEALQAVLQIVKK